MKEAPSGDVLTAHDLLNFKHDPLVVQTPTRGEVALRFLSCAGVERLQRLRSDVPRDSEFVRRAVHAHLVTPAIPYGDFERWPSDDVQVLARAWSGWSSGLHRELPSVDIDHAFVSAFDEYLAESTKQLQRAFTDLSGGMAARLAELRTLGPDPSLLAFFRATEAERRLFSLNESIAPSFRGIDTGRTLAEHLDIGRGAIAGLGALDSVYPSGILAASKELQRIVSRNNAAFQNLATMTAGVRAAAEYESSLNAKLALLDPAAHLVSLGTGLESLSGATKRLFDEWVSRPEIRPLDSLWLGEAPGLEFYSASRSALALVESPTETAPEAAERLEVVAGTVEPLLAALHPDLVEVYHGAVSALEWKGPDYRRHFASSCRELLSHVLRRLAPDDAVRTWDGARPEDFVNDRPTRRVRARYILHHAQGTAYGQFAENDVAQVVDLLEFLHGPAHGIDTREERAALRLILMRVEAFVALLLEADRLRDA